jgi:putative transposase
LGKSTVSRICEAIKEQFDTWRIRDLSEVAIDYLFVDASHFKIHDGARSEPVLVAYGITTEGNSVLLHLDGISAESTDACVSFLEDMIARWLGSPVLTVTDGAPGLCAAIDQVFPRARRQRCLIHRSRNCLAKVSDVDQPAVRAEFWEIFDIGDEHAPGEPAVTEARRRARQFADTWGRSYPSAVTTVIDGLDELVAHLHYPRAHWPRIRHTNLISVNRLEGRGPVGTSPGRLSSCAYSLELAEVEHHGSIVGGEVGGQLAA